ncbi:MAG: RecX family transcriptional regulator [Tissierellaceae bacterium]|nr:RecX family transcriptional regulator [Tissierellaceae bacterium]
MKITSIERQKNKNRVNIYVDNLFSIGIDEEIMLKYGLHVEMEVDDEFIKEVLAAEELNKTINHALNLLSYRQRSEKEIFQALMRKGYNDSNIHKAIEYCKELKYIDDLAFAESYVRDKINLSKLGSERIKYELSLKGVSRNIIDKVLIIDKSDQYEAALELAQKQVKKYEGDSSNAIYRKLGGYLQRKGYSFDIISKVLRQVLKD